LTENIDTLNEGGQFGELETSLNDIKDLASTYGKVGVKDLKALLGRLGLEFKLSEGQILDLLKKPAKDLEIEFRNALVKDTINGEKIVGSRLPTNSREISKVGFLKKLIDLQKSKPGQQLSVQEIETLKNQVISDNALYAKNLKSTKAYREALALEQGKTPPPIKDKGDVDRGRKEIDRNPEIKTFPWKKFLKWGTGIGLTTGALYWLYKATHGEEPPVVTGDIPPSPTPTPRPVDPRQYHPCPTGPYSKWCKADAVKRVQSCLGLTVDGFYGPLTNEKLKSLGYNSFRDEDIEKICGGAKEVNPWTNAPDTIDSAAPTAGTQTAGNNNTASSSEDDIRNV
jgi:hypothetical protein